MPKTRMQDVLILLPGITGSVLERHGRPIWAASGSVLWEALRRPGELAESLRLLRDDPQAEDLGDGVRATGLIRGLQLIPGLVKIVDGYGEMCDAIARDFEIVPGALDSPHPANFFAFPYDWRRDNRFSARCLQRLIKDAVHRWRAHTGNQDAKAILVAHSMGGLIARYCLEVLESWPLCRALITFGTPFRGSPQALEYLANGYRKARLDLTAAMRSCTSVYQLLPIYKAVCIDGTWVRAGEAPGIPNVDPDRAAAALAFHREIEAAEQRPKAGQGYLTLPIIGTDQPTSQSAVLEGGALTVANEAPGWIDPLLSGGDGTVPVCSAIPLSLSDSPGWPQAAESHGALQSHKGLLTVLRNTLTQLQVRGLGAIRDPAGAALAGPQKPGIAADFDDVFLASEPVVLRAEVHRNPVPRLEGLVAHLRSDRGFAAHVAFTATGDRWVAEIPPLPPDLYRVEIAASAAGPGNPDPVHGLFAVT